MKSFKTYIKLYINGIIMGGADVIPGVSGGTIAFITGIYTTLIASLHNFDARALQLLGRGQIISFFKKINASFLFPLTIGILTSVFSVAHLVLFLLNTYPIAIWSFFFGLIASSFPLILRDIKKWNLLTALYLGVGIVSSYMITTLDPIETSNYLPFTFLYGALAICAMILPGISGSFILVLLGQYEYIMQAITDINILVMSVFFAGCIFGLLSFSRILNYSLQRYRNYVLALLGGFMMGSLNKVWPWKVVFSYHLDSLGNIVPDTEKNVFPQRYTQITGEDHMLLQALMLMAIGILLVILIHKIASRTYVKP